MIDKDENENIHKRDDVYIQNVRMYIEKST